MATYINSSVGGKDGFGFAIKEGTEYLCLFEACTVIPGTEDTSTYHVWLDRDPDANGKRTNN
jgi:hypothetical protein